jgi:hypothetical protein
MSFIPTSSPTIQHHISIGVPEGSLGKNYGEEKALVKYIKLTTCNIQAQVS